MLNKIMCIYCLAIAMLAAALPAQAENNERVTGAWHAQATRNGSVARPVMFLFHSDGTMQYLSSTTIHSSATATPEVFSGRSGGFGVYRPVPGRKNTYRGYTEELMYDDVGNAKGRFLVEFTFTFPKSREKIDATFSADYRFKITSFTPANLGTADAITGETVELSDNGQLGQISGYRLEASCYFSAGAAPCHENPVETVSAP